MYGITDHYFQTLHDFNSLGEGLEAFLLEQALKGSIYQGFHVNVVDLSTTGGKA